MSTALPRLKRRFSTIGVAVAIAVAGLLIGHASQAAAQADPPQAHATAQSVNLALAAGALTLEVSEDGGTKASNDGTGSVAPVTNTPAVALLDGQSLLTAGVLSETAQANVTGSSYACAGILSPGGTIEVGAQGQTCRSTGNGTGGVRVNLNQLPGGIGGLLSPVATVSLEADAIIANAYQAAPGTGVGNASIVNLRVHVSLVGGLLTQTIPVELPADPNADVLPAVISAIAGANNPLLSPLVQLLTNTISPAVEIKANYQNTENGMLTVSALHISLVGDVLATADLAKVTVGPNLAPTSCNPFQDVDESNPFCQNINWLKIEGITHGYENGTLYRPVNTQTRQAMAAFMYRYYSPGQNDLACTPYPWPDVDASNEHCGSIGWMKAQSLANGYDDGLYHPERNVSRQAIAAFLYRATHDGAADPGCTTQPYPDVTLDNEFCGAITWFKEQGITTGYEDGTFRPTSPVTRQAMAAWIHRYSTMYARPQL